MARDISILLLTAVLCGAALWRPWLGVIGMAFVEFLHPQGYGSNAVGQIPAFLAMFIAALAGFVRAVVFDNWRPRLFWDWRLAVFVMLWSWFAATTYVAINPWLGVPKMIDVAKILPPLALALLLIDSREKLRVMVIAIALSIALIAAKGGFWAVMTGFHDRVYGPFGSPWAGNNEFAVAAAAAIPLLVLWLRETPDRVARGAIMLLIAAAYAAALSSWSRGGLLSICAVTALIVWNSKYKLLAIPAALALAVLVATSFPENWLARMGTIVTFQDDPSAQGRLRVWQLGIAFVKQWPWMGAGFEAWIFFRGGGAGPRDWHSAYIEVAAEHGLIGLALWVLLLFGTMVSLTWLAWQGKRRAVPWMVDYGTMLRASLVGYAIGAVFLGIAYWPLPYWLVAAAILAHAFAARETSPHPAHHEIRSQSNVGAVRPAIPTSRESRALGAVSLLIGCLVLLPPQVFGGSGSTGTWLGGYLGNVSWNIYQLIKVAMLVVPAGFVLALAGWAEATSRWAVRASAVTVLVALPIAIFAPAGREALQLLFAVPGLAAGLWFADRTGPSLDRRSMRSEASIRHEAPAIAATALRDQRSTGEPLIKSDPRARVP